MRLRTRPLALTILALAAAAVLATPSSSRAEPPVTGKQAHRLYDDRGVLDWRAKLGEAQLLAKERRRLIFVEFGRES
jgi:hypothetical protein